MDDEQFRRLFAEHLPAGWGFSRRRCAAADVADDVAAETFAIAWRRRDDLPAPDGVRLWLLATARRVLANQRRSDGRRDRLHQRVAAAAPVGPVPPDPADEV